MTSTLIVACTILAALAPVRGQQQEPERVCEAVEFYAESQGFDPWRIAALAWHESRFIPNIMARDGGPDSGPMQVRPAWSPFNQRQLRTAWLGIAGGVFAAVVARDWAAQKGRPAAHWLRCYASGLVCAGGPYLREIDEMQARLEGVARAWERQVCDPEVGRWW